MNFDFVSNLKNRMMILALSAALVMPLGLLMADDSEDGFYVGGAVRYNFLIQDYEDEDVTPNDAQFTWDTWRINVSGQNNGVLLDFEYRFYPTFGTHFIHHGWVGYNFSENTQMQLGVTQVPFGDLTYASA